MILLIALSIIVIFWPEQVGETAARVVQGYRQQIAQGFKKKNLQNI